MPVPKKSPEPKLRPKYLGLDQESINEIENMEAEDKMIITDDDTGETQKFSYGGDVRFNANRGKTY
jgi:hypothetical protein